MTMVERVARAICGWGDSCCINTGRPCDYEVAARAAILAMREEDLIEALALRRFEKAISKAPDGCWHWTGAIDRRDGYGHFYPGRGATIAAHRFAYECARGPVPDGKVIDHVCRCRHCVNPEHLRAVDNVTNVMCGIGVTAVNARKETCKHGHPLEGDNLYIRPNGERDCKECRRSANRRRKSKMRSALTEAEESGG